MLFTRCPECDTTFRVTDETLKKANGQVRCGRCASVFNAYAELHDPTARSKDPDEDGIGEPSAQAPTAAEAAEAAAVAEASPETGPISANEIERVLATNAVAPLPPIAYPWPPRGVARSRSGWWATAAVLASVALGAQALHHFRADVAGHPKLGPWVIAAYRALGRDLAPSWDVRQYDIVDWVATAEPNASGLGSLKITARIQNRGPLRQPYPSVQLRLKDRWEEAVGERMFTPAEYLPSDAMRERLMSPGETARAVLEVVDPGPDAYGFELDVCIEVEASLVTCGSDEVFL